jgi:hypothetical protein
MASYFIQWVVIFTLIFFDTRMALDLVGYSDLSSLSCQPFFVPDTAGGSRILSLWTQPFSPQGAGSCGWQATFGSGIGRLVPDITQLMSDLIPIVRW